MFERLKASFSESLRKIAGLSQISDKNIEEALGEVRQAFIEADVPVSVIDLFLEKVRAQVIGAKVVKGIRPGEQFIKNVYDELVKFLGEADCSLNLRAQPPAVILLAGLQGSGKTTSAIKLASWLKLQHKKRALLTSCDVYRPAAIEQLQTLARQQNIDCTVASGQELLTGDPEILSSEQLVSLKPQDIARNAQQLAKKRLYDVLIVDTAGRLNIDPALMDELKSLQQQLNPVETLLIVDSMIGQDSLYVARDFKAAVNLTGVILTKMDSDTRGGAALAMRQVTGCPIKFLGISEKADGLEKFHADRISSRILGMGDIVSLVEEAYQKLDHQQSKDITRKVFSGERINLEDLRSYLLQITQIGGMSGILDKMPMLSTQLNAKNSETGDQEIKRMLVVIDSMTRKERQFPATIRQSQRQRIAKGSGTSMADVTRVLKYFEKMQKELGRLSSGKFLKALSGLMK